MIGAVVGRRDSPRLGDSTLGDPVRGLSVDLLGSFEHRPANSSSSKLREGRAGIDRRQTGYPSRVHTPVGQPDRGYGGYGSGSHSRSVHRSQHPDTAFPVLATAEFHPECSRSTLEVGTTKHRQASGEAVPTRRSDACRDALHT